MGPKQNGDRGELMRKLWDSVQVSSSVYDHFELIGRVGVAATPDYADPRMHRGKAFESVDNDVQERILKLAGNYCYTKSTKKHLDVSVRKMDKQPCYKFLDDPYYERAFDYVKRKFEDGLTQPHMTPSEILADLDLTKAPGFFETWRGFRTKADCVLGGVLSEYMKPEMLDEVPIWKVSGKNEIKETDDYVGKFKQRTFIIEPFNMLWHDKRIFGNQSNGLKNNWWSAYGFNPYDGGVGSLWTTLSRFRRYWEWDVVGYDRIFALMAEVCKIRTSFSAPDPFTQWVTDNKIRSILVLPNGDIISKYWGNNSGSGTTTGDNIIGMSIILSHAFFRAGLNEKQVDELVHAFIFGDDVLGGDNLEFSDEFMRELFISTFALYGYTLDPLIISHSIEGMSFLGFELHEMDSHFVPKYKLPRLAFSFANAVSDSEDTEKELSKMMSLMLMSVGHGREVYDLFRLSLKQSILRSTCKMSARLMRNGLDSNIPTFDDTLAWCVGMESTGSKVLWSEVEQNFCFPCPFLKPQMPS